MDPRIFPSSAYNCIKTIQELSRISYDDLYRIAEFFLDNGAEDHGVCYVHRHFDIAASHVMVHEMTDEGDDLCIPRPIHTLSSVKLSPNCLCLNKKGLFQAYEYNVVRQEEPAKPMPETGFLLKFARLLFELGHEETIGIMPNIAAITHLLIETLVPEIGAMKYQTLDERWTGEDFTGDVTAYRFSRDVTGRIQIIDVKNCKPLPTGLHPPPKPKS